MTSMPRLMAVAEASDDVAAELTNLRAAYQAACAELIDCRRQRDEAIAHGQELLARLVEADEKLAGVTHSAEPSDGVGSPDAETIRVAPPTPTPAPISPVPTIVGTAPGPVAVELVAEPDVDTDADAVAEADAVFEDEPLAEVVPVQPVRWLPPAEDGTTSSTAHEFAALKELESDVADEAPPTTEPLASPMNILPDVAEEPKGSRWRLRVR